MTNEKRGKSMMKNNDNGITLIALVVTIKARFNFNLASIDFET